MNNKWTREEELNFIVEISKGEQMDKLATKHNRTVMSLETRLQKIIYENMLSGKSIDKIAEALKMSVDKVREYNNNYRELKEKCVGIENIDSMHAIQQNTQQDLPKQEPILHGGGNDDLISKITNRIKQLDLENQMMKTIIDNKRMHITINKMVKDGILDPNVKTLIKEVKKSNKKNNKNVK